MPHDDAWRRFLGYVSFARDKPAFDREEREQRAEVAERARAVLDPAPSGDDLGARVRDLAVAIHGDIESPYNLVNMTHLRWLSRWAEADPGSLRDALAHFASAEDPVANIAAFDAAVQASRAPGDAEPNPAAVVAIGAVFNFALAPDRLPIVRLARFKVVGQTLGLESWEPVPAAAEYERGLDFARDLWSAIADAGVTVRDMIDAESLISLAAVHREWWAAPDSHVAPPGAAAPERTGDRAYLSICAIYFDEAPYLREWIEFHRLVGVERFFLYDNGSTDEHLDVLAPYLADESVVLHRWLERPGQMSAYADSLDRHRDDSRWIAFIDTDEFLFSPTGRPMPEVLGTFEPWPAVVANAPLFGPSGHRTRPGGLVIENYVRPFVAHRARAVKSIVDPRRTTHPASPHHFEYSEGMPVDENVYPARGPVTKSVSLSTIRVNHYVTKSDEEFEAKLARPRADAAPAVARMPPARQFAERPGGGRSAIEGPPDTAIFTYVPALRAAVEKAESG